VFPVVLESRVAETSDAARRRAFGIATAHCPPPAHRIQSVWCSQLSLDWTAHSGRRGRPRLQQRLDDP